MGWGVGGIGLLGLGWMAAMGQCFLFFVCLTSSFCATQQFHFCCRFLVFSGTNGCQKPILVGSEKVDGGELGSLGRGWVVAVGRCFVFSFA